MIKVLATDVDGVLTDGKIYVDSSGKEQKSFSFKDVDAVAGLRLSGIKLAIITGEDNFFTDYVKRRFNPDYMYVSCKDKGNAIEDIASKEKIQIDEIAYIGDGKYDISAFKKCVLSFCPSDAIYEVKELSFKILKSSGGLGCLKEASDYVCSMGKNSKEEAIIDGASIKSDKNIDKIMDFHLEVLSDTMASSEVKNAIKSSINEIIASFRNGGQLLICGNGGSAADAQHIATEFVSRFFMEREALNAEALTVNTSSLTAIANDYEYNRVFSRQIEAKGKPGDILIGITTSGSSKNIMEAFDTAKKMGMKSIAFVGKETAKAFEYADIVVSVPSECTPRVQEMHIMIGHIICEEVERRLFKEEIN